MEMITGKVYVLDKSAWKSEGKNTTLTQLPTWDSPLLLAEREQVDPRPPSSHRADNPGR